MSTIVQGSQPIKLLAVSGRSVSDLTMPRLSILVLSMTVAMTVLGENRHQKELKEHYDHLSYIAEFKCHVPQARVVSVYDLFPDVDRDLKAYFPDVTVLHQCDHYVGCCTTNHVCTSRHTDTINLPFKITFLKDTEKHKKGSWTMEYHVVHNHTECGCQEQQLEEHPSDWGQSSTQ